MNIIREILNGVVDGFRVIFIGPKYTKRRRQQRTK